MQRNSERGGLLFEAGDLQRIWKDQQSGPIGLVLIAGPDYWGNRFDIFSRFPRFSRFDRVGSFMRRCYSALVLFPLPFPAARFSC
jgi:hypothetical protein